MIMKTIIVAIQSTVTGQWNYCPQTAVPILGRILELDEKPSGYATAEEAFAAARQNRKVPKNAEFRLHAK